MAVRDYDSCVSEVAKRLRLDTTADATLLALCQGWLDDTIQDIHGRHDWFWSLDRQVVQTEADDTTGTVSVSAGGTAVTGSSTAFASSDVGRFIQFQGSNDWYRISSVSTPTALVIDSPGYNGTSALSAGTYVIRTIFYSIPSAEKLLTGRQAQTNREITCIHYRDFDTWLTFADGTGKATLMCVYGLDSSNRLRISIHPHADAAFNMELRYKKVATVGSLAGIPPKWYGVYIDGALLRGLEYVAVGQPEFKMAAVDSKRSDYERGIARMLADAEPESDYQPVLQNRDVRNSLPSPRLPDGLSIPLD